MSRILLLLALAAVPARGSDPSPARAAAPESYVEKLPGGVSFQMVAIKGGTFQMGSPEDEAGRRNDEGPRRKVAVPPFWIGKHEVTWEEYRLFYREKPAGARVDAGKGATDAVSKPSLPYIDETYGFGDAGYPAFNMSHHAAMTYCEWLSKKTGRRYRLPTEAEWEYACRAGTSTRFACGDQAGPRGEEAFWHRANSGTEDFPGGQAHPVGRRKPNAWGLHDMHGNVAEWCLDHYEAKRYQALPWDKPALNPLVPPTEKRYSHVTRGGDFRSVADDCRSASRRGSSPKWNAMDPEEPPSIWWMVNRGQAWVGFRVVRADEDPPALANLRPRVTKDSKD